MVFYKEKQKRRTGSEDDFVKCIRISPAEGEFAVRGISNALTYFRNPVELAICRLSIALLSPAISDPI